MKYRIKRRNIVEKGFSGQGKKEKKCKFVLSDQNWQLAVKEAGLETLKI